MNTYRISGESASEAACTTRTHFLETFAHCVVNSFQIFEAYNVSGLQVDNSPWSKSSAGSTRKVPQWPIRHRFSSGLTSGTFEGPDALRGCP